MHVPNSTSENAISDTFTFTSTELNSDRCTGSKPQRNHKKTKTTKKSSPCERMKASSGNVVQHRRIPP